MRARLSAPLGPLAAATRAHDARSMAAHMTEFNATAEALLPALERDASANADAAALRDAIGRVRQAYGWRDAGTLDAVRLLLVDRE